VCPACGSRPLPPPDCVERESEAELDTWQGKVHRQDCDKGKRLTVNGKLEQPKSLYCDFDEIQIEYSGVAPGPGGRQEASAGENG
jgi:hypothetical protein